MLKGVLHACPVEVLVDRFRSLGHHLGLDQWYRLDIRGHCVRVKTAVPNLISKNISHLDATLLAAFVIRLNCDSSKLDFDLILPLLTDVAASQICRSVYSQFVILPALIVKVGDD